MPTRRGVLTIMALFGTGAAIAQEGDSRSIRLIVPFAVGGSTDLVARLLGAAASPVLGQSIIVDNRTGAGTILGSSVVAKASPDGNTLLFATVAHAINPTLQAHMPYSQADFTAVARVATVPLVLSIHPSVPANTLAEFLAYVRANPGKVKYGSAGIGSALHMAGEVLKYQAKLDVVHVPYRGAGPAMNDLMSGQVQFIIDPISTSAQQIVAKNIRALAVTSERRSPSLPDVPTFHEAGMPDYEASTWNVVLAPKGTAASVVRRLNEAINRTMSDPALVDRLRELDVIPISDSSPESTAAYIALETERWAVIIKSAGLKVDN
jgi:tripartite-type tricarboxylate transporter receptor subunit TctC